MPPPTFRTYAEKVETVLKYQRSAQNIIRQSKMGTIPESETSVDPVPAPPAVASTSNPVQTPIVLTKAQIKFQERYRLFHGIKSDEDTVRVTAALRRINAANIQSREAPKTRSHRQRVKEFWEIFVNMQRQSHEQIPPEKMWDVDVIVECMKDFLPAMLDATPPRKGYTVLKASTLLGWYNLFVQLVIENARDAKGAKKGYTLLGEHLDTLKDQLVGIIFDRNLSRTLNKKYYFGRAEVQQILSALLEASAGSGLQRTMNLQFGFAILIIDYSTSRPCGLAAASKWLADRGLYLKLKDFTLYNRGPMNWEVRIHMTHFKGALNSVVADEQHIVLKSVGKAHNTLFDPTLWAISYWFARGVFEKDYATLAELCNDQSAQINFKSDKLEEPAFVAGKEGGFGLSDPPIPQSSGALSRSFADWSKKAGLPRSGLYALRREAGNMFALQLGTEAAKDIMNHATEGVFRRHYSKNAENFDLVGVRTGEVAGNMESFPGQVLKEQNDKTLFLSAAVENMVRSKEDLEETTDLEEQYETSIREDPTAIDLAARAEKAFQDLLSSMTPDAKMCKMETYHLNLMMKRATKTTKEEKHPRILSGCEIKARESHATLISLLSKSQRVQANIRRNIRREIAQIRDRSFAAGSLSGTVADREQAIQDVIKPSEQLLAAARTASTIIPEQADSDIFSGDNRDIGRWKATLDQAIYEDEDEDETLHEEGRKGQANLNRLGANIELELPKESSSVPVPLKDSEEDEVDILNIPLPDIKYALLQQYLNPIFRDRLLVKREADVIENSDQPTATATAKPRYVCPKCDKDYAVPSALRKHTLQIHSPWKELLFSLRKPPGSKDRIACPSGDYTTCNVRTGIEKHLLQDCVDKARYQKMKEEYCNANARYMTVGGAAGIAAAQSKEGGTPGNVVAEYSPCAEADIVSAKPVASGEKNVAESSKRKRYLIESDDSDDADDADADNSNDPEYGHLFVAETISRKDMVQKLKSKKFLATYVNILLRIGEAWEQHQSDLRLEN